MSMDTAAFRKEVMSLIKTFMNAFDSSGKSAERLENEFKNLDDKSFVKTIKSILDNPKRFFTPQIAAFDKKTQPKFETFQRLAKLVDTDLEEYVVLPYMNENSNTKNLSVTITKVPVGMLHLKRLQQMVRKKNKLSTSIEQRDQRNGQVRNEDKGGRITDADMYALEVFSAHPIMKEFYGPRADSMDAKEKLYDAIRKGERLPRMSDLPNSIDDKVAINTLNQYLLGASLVSDLISDSYLLPITKKELLNNKINKESI